MLRTKMTTLAFILCKLFPIDCFRCNFVSAPKLEYPLGNYHDTSNLRRTGLVDVLHIRMTTLTFILPAFYPLDAISCPLCTLNTFWYFIMTLYCYVNRS